MELPENSLMHISNFIASMLQGVKMQANDPLNNSYERRLKAAMTDLRWNKMHLDPILLLFICALSIFGLFILYSASNQNIQTIKSQTYHFIFAATCLVLVAQISPRKLLALSPWLYSIGLILLMMVPIVGHTSQGAKRWVGFMSIYIQPSEIMKIAMPMMLAWVLDQYKSPPTSKILLACFTILIVPVALIIKQPDLGTAIIIAISGFTVIILAGISWKYLASFAALILALSPVIWHHLHAYQKNRILTLLNPENDPLGSGYNIIQSKIAVGSGGFLGKGWLNGTQSHLAFLPTHTTDFIFAVNAEELGFIGSVIVIFLLFLLLARCLYISYKAQSSYTRLLTGAISLTFITGGLINIGMVIGILPVVGIPLPLISYGGTYIVTTFIAFGIMMSVHTHKKLWPS
jgi:rod shape determining protein RodA